MIDTKIIKIAMIENNISVIELARKLDINVNTVSRWINNKNIENVDKFLEMLKILNIEIKDIKKG